MRQTMTQEYYYNLYLFLRYHRCRLSQCHQHLLRHLRHRLHKLMSDILHLR